MTSNAEAAEIFRTIADLLDVLGEKFKPEAYRRAARSIESLTEDLSAVAKRGELRSIPGVGEAIAEKIEEYLGTGAVPYFERLKREVPPGLVELMRLPGLGPKSARRFWVELGVEGPNELKDALAAGRLDGMKGFGEKKLDLLRTALAAAAAGGASARRPIADVYPIAHELLRAIRERAVVDRVEIAGSFRRARESVGDLDILATSKDPPTVFEAFSSHARVAEVKMRGETKETVLLSDGLQVDLRVVKPEEFGAALQYFTGSKDHNVHLRSLARERGLKVNEYGVFRGEERVAGASEEEVYAALGLAWIPPELREDRGEIDVAARGVVPRLISEGDLRGDLHIHLSPEATPGDVDRACREAALRGYAYVGFVVAGVSGEGQLWTVPEPTRLHLVEAPRSPVRVLTAQEVGAGSGPPELFPVVTDYRILRPTAGGGRPGSGASETPSPTPLVAHVGSAVAADATELAHWVELARRAGAAVEAGPGAERVDSTGARQFREAGVPLHVPTGLGAPAEDPTRAVALGFARRAGVAPEETLNARPLDGLRIGPSGPRRTPAGRSRGPPKARSGSERST